MKRLKIAALRGGDVWQGQGAVRTISQLAENDAPANSMSCLTLLDAKGNFAGIASVGRHFTLRWNNVGRT